MLLAREAQHRSRKRVREIKTVMDHLQSLHEYAFLRARAPQMRILDFGCGHADPFETLSKHGEVYGLDAVFHERAKAKLGDHYHVAPIEQTRFPDKFFDILFSNHVLEHLQDPDRAFQELRRIAKPNALFAFAVPTPLWLLLTIPAQYRSKFLGLTHATFSARRHSNGPSRHSGVNAQSLRQRCLPSGHGVESNFLKCLTAFKKRNWETLLKGAGFHILKSAPVLFYGPSEFPIVPTMRPMGPLSSSTLFILQ